VAGESITSTNGIRRRGSEDNVSCISRYEGRGEDKYRLWGRNGVQREQGKKSGSTTFSSVTSINSTKEGAKRGKKAGPPFSVSCP